MIKFDISKEFCSAAITRAIRTGAQTLLSMITVGMSLVDIDWKTALSVTIVSMIASLLTSVATGLPEISYDGKFLINDSDPEVTKWTMQYDGDPQDLKDGDVVKFKVSDDTPKE